MLDGIRRSIVETRAQDRHCVRVLEQRFEVSAGRWLVNPSRVDDAHVEIGDLEKLGNDEVDPGWQREFRMPTVIDQLERIFHPLQR